jgi:hypothetical protein
MPRSKNGNSQGRNPQGNPRSRGQFRANLRPTQGRPAGSPQVKTPRLGRIRAAPALQGENYKVRGRFHWWGNVGTGTPGPWRDLGEISEVSPSPSIEWYKRNPGAYIRDEILDAPEDGYHFIERQLADIKGGGRELYAGEVRLPVIRTPAAYVVAHVSPDAKPRTLESLKRMAEEVVLRTKRGPNWVAEWRDQAMDEKPIKFPVGYKPPETAAIRIRELRHLRNDREIFERRVAVLQEEADCMRVAALSLEQRLDRESADNVLLEGVIAAAYGALLNNHRAARKMHRNPADRASGGALDFCPTCDVLVSMRRIVDRRELPGEVKT